MVSTAKRMKYVSENDFSSSEGETCDDLDYLQPNKKNSQKTIQGSKMKSKWLSKNAIMARENRLKKKLYVTNLESEVGKLKKENENFNKIIESQSLLIRDLNKEIKYLKSVIANSSDIGNLIKNIHHNSGMSVSTSLDQTLSLNNDYVSKPKQPIARKTAHPWEEKQYPSFPTPESDFLSSPHSENDLNDFTSDDLFLDDIKLDAFLGVPENFIDDLPINEKTSNPVDEVLHLKEHNYTTSPKEDEEVGVCLHVSKHRVSIEFCPTCSNNAAETWKD